MKNVAVGRIALSFLAAVLAYVLPLGLEGSQHSMLFVLVFIVLLWITEAAPLHATAVFAAFLLVTLVGLEPKNVFAQYFDPVIVLLLGGFVIAVAMSKHGLDEYIAYKILGKTGDKPKAVVLGLIITATSISMWISNSAAAAIVMPIALVILAKNRMKVGSSNFGKACVLAVGFGATIGGIGTIIGSTPNVIAAKFLQDSGVHFGFYEWLYRGFPFMLLLMLVSWFVLVTIYKPEKKKIINIKKTKPMTNEQKKVFIIFGLTIFLWVTENVHGISSGVVALVPIILYYFSGLLATDDFLKVDWPTLVLVGGGLALGMGIQATSFDALLASLVSNAASLNSILILFLVLGGFGVAMTSVVSNTTAASVYLPVVVALASSFGADVTNTVLVAAIGVSMDFIFPFGTPPTALAYGTKFVNTKDIAKAGVIISLIGIVLLAFFGMIW